MPSQGHSPHQASFSQTGNTPINPAEPSLSQGFRETTQIGEAKTLALQCFLSSYSCWNTRECLLYIRPVQTRMQTSSPRAGSHFQGHCALTIRILSSDTSQKVCWWLHILKYQKHQQAHTPTQHWQVGQSGGCGDLPPPGSYISPHPRHVQACLLHFSHSPVCTGACNPLTLSAVNRVTLRILLVN